MAAKNFEDLVRNRVRTGGEQFDWEPRKAWWVSSVEGLMNDIRVWLAPLAQEQLIRFDVQPVDITEERLGHYRTVKGVVTLDGMSLSLSPAGTLIIGGYGRIDVDGPNGTAMLILADEGAKPDIERPWEQAKWYVTRPVSRSQLAAVNEASFKQLLADLYGLGV